MTIFRKEPVHQNHGRLYEETDIIHHCFYLSYEYLYEIN